MRFATVYKPNAVDGVSFEDAPSLTQQQFKESCDIGAMIRRALSGDMSVFCRPQYMDVLCAPEDFHDAASRSAAARTIWEELPEEVRATYGSPEALLLDYDRQQRRLADEKAAHDEEIKRAEALKSAIEATKKVETVPTSGTPAPTTT